MLKILLAFLLSISANAAQPGAVPSVTLSAPGANTGSVSITPSQLSGPCAGAGTSPCFSIYAGGSVAANAYYPFLKDGVAYQVTTGLKAHCFDFTSTSNSTTVLMQYASSTSSVSAGTTGTLTGGVYQCGTNGVYCALASTATANQVNVVPGLYTFGALSFPVFQANFGTSTSYFVHADCFEAPN